MSTRLRWTVRLSPERVLSDFLTVHCSSKQRTASHYSNNSCNHHFTLLFSNTRRRKTSQWDKTQSKVSGALGSRTLSVGRFLMTPFHVSYFYSCSIFSFWNETEVSSPSDINPFGVFTLEMMMKSTWSRQPTTKSYYIWQLKIIIKVVICIHDLITFPGVRVMWYVGSCEADVKDLGHWEEVTFEIFWLLDK